MFGRKKKEIEELGRAQRAAGRQRKMFGDVFDEFDDAHVLFNDQALLRVITEDDGFTDVDLSAIGGFQALKDIDKSGFADPVLPDDAYAFAAFCTQVPPLTSEQKVQNFRL